MSRASRCACRSPATDPVSAAVILELRTGTGVATRAPRALIERIDSVTVQHNDEGRSGFSISVKLGREPGYDDYTLTRNGWLRVGDRVILSVILGGESRVLMDGVVTQHALSPGAATGEAALTVTGEDLSVMMDTVSFSAPFPNMTDSVKVLLLLAPFAALGVVPLVIPALTDFPKLALEGVDTHSGTPLGMIQAIAEPSGYVTYLDPGPTAGMSIFYFGPRIRAGLSQRALTVNMGAATNVRSISFNHDGTKPTLYAGLVQDDSPYISLPVPLPIPGVDMSIRQPTAAKPSLVSNFPLMKLEWMDGEDVPSSWFKAMAKAAGMTAKTAEAAVTASGELDVARYGTVLKARGMVDLRGAGWSYDGTWYVQSVTHNLRRGEYTQSFTLQREGLGSLKGKVSI